MIYTDCPPPSRIDALPIARCGAAQGVVSVNPLTCPVFQDVDPDRGGFELLERLRDEQARAHFAARGDVGALEQYHRGRERSAEHTSEPQSLMRMSYAVFCLKKTNQKHLEQN